MFLRRRQRNVAILGCGPAGLFAAHAFIEADWSVSIFSKKRRSEMFGAQYLHRPIPGLSTGGKLLNYTLVGTPEDYAHKVYNGAVPSDSVSPVFLQGEHEVWDIREAYFNAWDRYAARITHMPIDSSSINALLLNFDLVISSVPAPVVCVSPERHQFMSQKVYAIGDAPERGIFCPVEVDDMEVRCNGLPNPGWYRASNVFGYRSAEWPHESKPPIQEVAEVSKPIRTTCNCWNNKKFHRVGRYGTWTKGVLSHEAYNTARSLL